MNKICVKSGVQQKLNATKMRHYIATEYALLDVDPQDREIFYTHMGHSQGNLSVSTCSKRISSCSDILKFSPHVSDIQQVLSDQRMKCTAISYQTVGFFIGKSDRFDSFQELCILGSFSCR